MTRKIHELEPQEVLALAIRMEQANGKRLRLFADLFEGKDPETARKFRELAAEENRHEEWLTEKFKRRFEGAVPPVGEFEVEGALKAFLWDVPEEEIQRGLQSGKVFQMALESENRTRKFYQEAIPLTDDKSVALLFRVLAAMEQDHVGWLEKKIQNERTQTEALGGKP